MAFVANGACCTVQKVQQINFGGNYKNEFMIIALSISALLLLAAAFFSKKEDVGYSLKKGFPYYSVSGIANGAVNYLVLVLSTKMAASLMFPIISAGGIIFTMIVSLLLYKEKLSLYQKIGFAFGLASVVVLNI